MRLGTIVLAVADASLLDQLRQRIVEAFAPSPTIVETDVEAITPALLHSAVIITHNPDGAIPLPLRRHHLLAIVDGEEAQRVALRLGASESVDVATLDAATLRRAILNTCDRSAEADRLRTELRTLHTRVDEGLRLRNLADVLPIYLAYVDSDRRYVFVNHQFGLRFHRPVSELVGRTVAEIVGPHNYTTIQPRLDAALAGERVRFELRLELESGEGRHMDLVYVPDRGADGTVVGCFLMGLDITDRKRAESLTQRVLDNLFCYVWILELDGTVLEANQVAPVADLQRGELLGRKFWDGTWWSYSPVVRDRLRDACERAGRGETVRYDVEVRTHTDARMTLDLQVAPLRDLDGRITHVIPSAVDVTDRCRVEHALRESEERSRLAQSAGGVGVWEFDPISGETFWSDAMWQIHGVTPDPGVDPRQVFEASLYPDDAERMREHAERVRQLGEDSSEIYRIIDGRGEVRWIEATAAFSPRADGSPRILGVNIDITRRKLAEDVVRDSDTRLRLAQEAGKLGIHDYDVRRDVLMWDQRAREICGYSLDEPITQATAMACVHPDDREAVLMDVAKALEPGSDDHYLLEHRVIHRIDGRVVWIAIAGRTTFEDGVPVRMVGTVLNITERKQAEEALQRSEEQLRESDRRKDEFLAMLGHELRNPLAAIRSASELLSLWHLDEPRLMRVGDVLERQSKHMVHLVDGLLDIARIARGKIDLEWAVVDVRTVLEMVLEDHQAKLERRSLSLDVDRPDHPLPVWGDEVRLFQILDNLISNAVKFTRDPGRIQVRARREGATVIVVVEDSGVGIRAEMLEAIFEPFQQDPQQLARAAGGLGVGLALVRGLVGLHHGTVTVRSRGLGLGAAFEVRLPLDERG